MTAPLLVYSLDGPGRERLIVETDGIARYLILTAAHPQWANRAGLFQAQLSSARLEAAETIARDLVATVPRPRGRTGPVVTATVGAEEASHPLGGPGEAAADLLSDLIEAVRVHPLAVVSFAAEVINDVDVRLRWESVGTEPIDLRVARDSCRVTVRTGDTWEGVWASTASTRLALVAAPDGFVDGVNSPATLRPGTIARSMLPGVLPGADAARNEGSVEIAGWIEIEDPAAGNDDDLFQLDETIAELWPIRLRAVFGRP